MSKPGIHIKPENRGKFNATKKKTGKTTEELTHSKNPVTKKRAIFAQNAKKWKHEDGGFLNIIGGPQEYSLGSWLGDNAGNLAQTIGGAALIATGVGVAPGAAMMASGAGGFAKTAIQNKIGDQEEELNNKKNLAAIGQNRLNQYNNQSYLPTFAVGGSMTDYGLGSYTSKDIFPPQNMYGHNLMATGGHLPEGNATLKEAKEYIKLYPEEMKMGEEVEYEHTGNQKLAQRIAADHIKDHLKMVNTPDYYTELKAAGISDELNKMGMGGKLKSEKAKEILKDGTIRGKALTDRQKRYFGFVAGGGTPKKQEGGPLDNKKSNATTVVHNYQWSPETRASIYPYLAKAGLMGTGADSLSFQQWNSLPADSTIKYLNNENFDYTKGNTANPGGIKYWNRDTIGEISSGKGFSDNYWTAKNQMSKANGGYFGTTASIGEGLDAPTFNDKNLVTEYKGGGTHQENSLGGIPIGNKAKVEEGEVRVDFDEGSYIFSNKF
jgi:hypothetical protein